MHLKPLLLLHSLFFPCYLYSFPFPFFLSSLLSSSLPLSFPPLLSFPSLFTSSTKPYYPRGRNISTYIQVLRRYSEYCSLILYTHNFSLTFPSPPFLPQAARDSRLPERLHRTWRRPPDASRRKEWFSAGFCRLLLRARPPPGQDVEGKVLMEVHLHRPHRPVCYPNRPRRLFRW